MINLLPPLEKESLLTEEKYRLITILCSLVLFFLISLSLILFALKIYLAGQAHSQNILVAAAESQFQNSEIQKLIAEINLANESLTKLDTFYKNQANLTKFLEKISKTVPQGMYLTSLSLQGDKVALGGYSASREILFEFKKRLEQEPSFEEILLPATSWVTPDNFTATFKLKI